MKSGMIVISAAACACACGVWCVVKERAVRRRGKMVERQGYIPTGNMWSAICSAAGGQVAGRPGSRSESGRLLG
jgi:hypothetical protein